MRSLPALILACLLLTAGPLAAQDGSPLTETKLYFGLHSADGAGVSEQQWADFLARTVTPRFPEGLTVIEARGQWRKADGVVHAEPTRLLVIVRPAGAERDRAVAEIKAEYVRRFGQESVFHTESPVRIVD